MGVRRGIGRWLRLVGDRLDPQVAGELAVGSRKLPSLPEVDGGPAAGDEETPSVPWQGVRERALGKSLVTLRSEALYSLGALHAAHLAAAAVFDDRRLAAAVAQRSGEAVSDDTLTKLAEAASIWHRDSASLGMALTAVGATQVPDLVLAEALQVDEQEAEALDAMTEGYQIELKRQILEEADS
ncbi:MAG: hypothetical protein AAFX65_13020 [Cyanobacteria bacterium J06638_7]